VERKIASRLVSLPLISSHILFTSAMSDTSPSRKMMVAFLLDSCNFSMKGTERGALFCVNDKLIGVQQEKIMAELDSQDVGSIVWKGLQDVLAPYL